jgi:two-component system sensor histidine kinase CreC
VHTLTHELKSPLAAIRGAAELLQGEMPSVERQRFVSNIDSESARMQQLIERLLNLALVEQRQGLEERVAVPLASLVGQLLDAQAARIEGKQLRVELAIPEDMAVTGEPFLLRQALGNLLENALDFTPVQGRLRFSATEAGELIEFRLFNQAQAIPDYALPRLSERFYSLPRPDNGRKSTGLGLNFVEEVVKLHGGTMSIGNVEGGVQVVLRLA